MENLYPVTCLHCDTPLTGRLRICGRCWPKLPWHDARRCPHCGRPGVDPTAPCGRCQRQPPAFRALHGPLAYTEPLPDWIQGLKYHQQLGLAPTLGALAATGLGSQLEAMPCDLLVPIPLHRARLTQRGFNQAQLLAAELARRTGLPLHPHGLHRTRDTRPQVGLADSRRGTNVRGAFHARPAEVADRRILLIDDVVTTGATADAAAAALLTAGARTVTVAAVARA